MNKIKFYLPILVFLGLFTLNSCSDDPVEPEPEPKTTYIADVAPILNASCNFSGCHNIGAANGSVANYTDAKVFAEGDRLLGALKHEDGFSPMPKNNSKLSDDKIATIEQWIADGILE